MTPVDVGPEFGPFWLLIFGVPALVLFGLVAYHYGWFGVTEGRLEALLKKAAAWEERLSAKRPPLLTKSVSATQQNQLAELEQHLALGHISQTDYEAEKAKILKETP